MIASSGSGQLAAKLHWSLPMSSWLTQVLARLGLRYLRISSCLVSLPLPSLPAPAKPSLGIGSFTIVDASIVQDPDLGVNFFLDDSCLGRSRAECCTKLLLELNPEVSGNWYPKNDVCHIPCTTSSSDSYNRIGALES